MNINASNQYIITKELKEEEITNAGIIVPHRPSGQQYQGMWGTVIKIGNKVESENIKIGKVILFNKYDAIPFLYKTKYYQVIKEPLVLGYKEKEED